MIAIDPQLPGPAVVCASASLDLVCREFLQFKHSRLLSGELSPRTYDGYVRACADLTRFFGSARDPNSIEPYEFGQLRAELAKRLGPRGLGTHIRMIRTLFKWAHANGLIDRPVRYGDYFDQPSVAACRRVTRGRGQRAYDVEEIRALLDACPPPSPATPMKTFIFLGINCGYAQIDCASLPADAADRGARLGLLDFERPKTFIERQAVLWPETIEALRACLPQPPVGLAFQTRRGNPWVRAKVHRDAAGGIAKVTAIDALGMQFNKLCDLAGVPRRGFCGLRRSFRTAADETGDFNAVARAMGHLLPGIAGLYIDRISRERLQAIADHVREWLFG